MSSSKQPTAQDFKDACFQYEQITRQMPIFFYAIDKDERLLFASQQVCQRLGLSSASACEASFYDYLIKHGDWLEARVQALRDSDLTVLNSEAEAHAYEEAPFTDNRGMAFFYEATRLPLKNEKDKTVGLMVFLNDVTARHLLKSAQANSDSLEAKKRPYPPSVYRDTSIPPRFLLIEDNVLAQEATAQVLKSLDCKVEVGATEEEVERLFKPGKFDVVLMDIGLEGTSGYLMAKKIRQIEGDSGYCVPIIALTGFDADVVKTDCDYYFMEGAMSKPLAMEQVRQMIQRYIYDTPVTIAGLKSLKQSPS